MIVRVTLAAISGSNEDSDRHGDFLLRDQVLQYLRNAQRTFGMRRSLTVLKDQNGRRSICIVLRGDEDPVTTNGIRDDLAVKLVRAFEFPFRHGLLRLGVRTEIQSVGANIQVLSGGDAASENQRNEQGQWAHGDFSRILPLLPHR
jgi:hypothetical protein